MSTCTPLNLFVTIDMTVFRTVVLQQLMQEPFLNLIGAASSGAETLKQLAYCTPNLLIIEEDLQDNDGLTIAEFALSKSPSLIIILLVESEISESRLKMYLESGIAAVVPKNQPLTTLIKTIHYVKNGQSYVDPEHLVKHRLLNPDAQPSIRSSLMRKEWALA